MSRCLPPRPGSTGTARMGERWRPVPACKWFGIPARTYEASSHGRVRTVNRTLTDGRQASGSVLAPSPDKDGYLRVKVARRPVGVHVLVCLAWHGVPEVRHLGDSNQDNRPELLTWGTRRENNGRDKREKRKREKEKKEEKFRTPSVPRPDELGR